MQPLLHYLFLAAIIALGAALRFWHLDVQPLWLDEIITALIASGRSYDDVPRSMFFDGETLHQLFTLNPEATCSNVTQTLITQSTHPPLFFCLMHQWLRGMQPTAEGLIWALRSLSAVFGVGAIAALYLLNRSAFSPNAGLLGAAMMAVSPFGVYLSQEARHYTLPIVLITLALFFLLQIQRDLSQSLLPRLRVWLAWSVVNSIGCYVHYFYILGFIAQILTLALPFYWQRRRIFSSSWLLAALVAVIGVCLSYLPWLPFLIGHFGREETDWLPATHSLFPLYYTLNSWLLMVIALPVENQPLWIAVPAGLLIFTFGIGLAWEVWKKLKLLWKSRFTQLSTLVIGSFIVFVLLQFLVLTYGLNKDITSVPRYHFIYFPALIALFSSAIAANPPQVFRFNPNQDKLRLKIFILILVGLISCGFVTSGLAFSKPFGANKVAEAIEAEASTPVFMIMAYESTQDIALGLSFALALERMRSDHQPSSNQAFFAFVPLHSELKFIQQQTLSFSPSIPSPSRLWIVSTESVPEKYPPQLQLGGEIACQNRYLADSLGIHQSLYACQRLNQ